MDPTSRPSPRRQLQGPRPPPLRVNKDSHKIKKPPPHPPAAAQPLPPYPSGYPPIPRRPIIIYDASPKIIHTKPSDFMSLVQRLTGNTSTADPASASTSSAGAALSPAARLATIEKSVSPRPGRNPLIEIPDEDYTTEPGLMNRSNQFPPGILSPLPSSLPSISGDFFSPLPFDPSCLAMLSEPSPVFTNNFAGNNNGFSNNFVGNFGVNSPMFLVSPNTLLSTPVVPSPGFCLEIFNQIQDF